MMVSAAAMIVLAVSRKPGKREPALAVAQAAQAATSSPAEVKSQEALAEGSAEGTAADADAQEPASAKEKEGRA
jgi:hypothetical protein